MFEELSIRIDKALRVLKGVHRISELNIAGTLREIRRALVGADVEYKLAKEVCDTIKEKALGERIVSSVSPGAHLTRIASEVLASLMGEGLSRGLNFHQQPSVMLIAGLQGTGKTTFAAKLALHLKQKGRRALLTACDLQRPAAIEQLRVLAKEIEVPFYSQETSKDAIQVAQQAIDFAKSAQTSVVILDTAGRTSVDGPMMQALKDMQAAVSPDEVLLVLDAMSGQKATQTALEFDQAIHFTGMVLAKMDSDTKGGAALSVSARTKRPILFVSTGEKVQDIAPFYPDRMAKRILGMGDVVSFVEKAEALYQKKEAQRIAHRIRKKEFDLNDYLSQLKKIRKMGNLKDMLSALPGLGKHVKDWDPNTETIFDVPAVIIGSMTPYERSHPDKVKKERRARIAKGSGRSIQEVNELFKRYESLRKLLKKGQTHKDMLRQQLKAQ